MGGSSDDDEAMVAPPAEVDAVEGPADCEAVDVGA